METSEQLNDYLRQRIDPESRAYVLLDEIQVVKDWKRPSQR